MSIKKHIFLYIFPFCLLSGSFFSCSTTRTLREDQLRLDRNEIVVTNSSTFPASSLSDYIKQQPNHSLLGWKPMLYIYNWSDGSDKGINKIWKGLGEAPVIYDQALVERSKKNIKSRLENIGYFNSDVES